jgi:ferredoxin--NADP+ reductase
LAKFDLTALREIGRLQNVAVRIGETAGDEANPVLDALREFAGRESVLEAPGRPVTITFHFGLSPTAIQFEADRTVLETRPSTEQARARRFTVDSVVTATGFTDGADAPPSTWDGRNVWRVGWLRRGARGTIPENRRDAKEVSDSIRAAVAAGDIAARKPGLAAIWPDIAERAVEFADWRNLETYERLQAPQGRARKKVTDMAEMIDIAFGAHPNALQLT